jgi:glycerol transport system ATP-binding protein
LRACRSMSVRLENVSVVSAGETIIDNVNLAFERGTMNVLLGVTLSGKTTLMRLMAGLDKPSSGRVFAADSDVTGTPVRKRSVAMVYQQFINYPSLTVYENIASPLRVARLAQAEVDTRVREAARVLGLEPLLDRLPAQLSGGQQQRTAIARAIVKGAELVLMDEPLANLDYKLREELREELPRILKQSGAVLVYATTEPLEALLLGGNTATLSKGRVIQFGPTADVYHHPNHIESARVFSDPPLNEIAIVKREGVIQFGDFHHAPSVGLLSGIADGAYTLAFRADAMSLTEAWPNSLKFDGRISVAEISGSESFVHVESPHGVLVCVEPGVSARQPGQPVTLYVDATRVFVFDRAGAPVAASQ